MNAGDCKTLQAIPPPMHFLAQSRDWRGYTSEAAGVASAPADAGPAKADWNYPVLDQVR